MLLRLEVDGFKNLIGFSAEFGAFTCIAGENGVGKSNVFDAIEFLSLLASNSLIEAARQVRSSRDDAAGEPEHLFTVGNDHRTMRFAAEMVVPSQVVDDFGTKVEPSITLLRYELELGYRKSDGPNRQPQLVVEREELHHINRGDANKHMRFPLSVGLFRNAVVLGERRGAPFISTEPDKERINVHQDGGSRGRPRRQLPTGASTTVVSTINSADAPTVLAARREMQSWRRLALEPTALRAADRFVDSSSIAPDGRHLASALHRIANESPFGTAEDVYARVANRVAGLAGVDIRSITVDVDEVRQLFSIKVTDGVGRELPARSLSEGTLRYLALCVLLEDPTVTGLISMEEPENGIHPANINQIVDLVRELSVDTTEAPGPDNPLRQVIVNTHSPAVVALIGENDLLYARQADAIAADGNRRRALRLLGMQGSWRDDGDALVATRLDLLPYLSVTPGAQISLFSVA